MNRFLLPILLTLLAASGWLVAYWQLSHNPQQPVNNAQPVLIKAPLPSLAPMLDQVMPAVVNISTRGTVATQAPFYEDPLFRYLFDPQGNQSRTRQKSFSSLGSGVIIDSEKGYVLTNHHVIESATEITVNLRDDREFSAVLIGSDKDTDVALLQITPDELIDIPLADSDKTRVGDFVVAIGNPFGLKHSVTQGIVSGLGRTGIAGGYEDLIQTDAPINRGNSGGALVNNRGQLVGINKAILSESGGSVGIGFAIPTNQVLDVMQQLVEFGEVRRGRLGVRGQTLTQTLAESFGAKTDYGVIVTQVTVGSAGHRAGLLLGDIIIDLNGRKVVDSQSLENAIGLTAVGNDITITAYRDGRKITLKTTLQAFVPEQVFGGDLRSSLQGAMFANAEDYRYPANYGVIITEVEVNSYAWELGLEVGDLITAMGRFRIGNITEMEKLLLGTAGRVRAQLQRAGTRYFLLIP